MIRSIKLFLAHIALKRFFFSMNILVPREQIPPISCVRAVCATITFMTGCRNLRVASWSGCLRRQGTIHASANGRRAAALKIIHRLGGVRLKFRTTVFQFCFQFLEVSGYFLEHWIVFKECVRRFFSVDVVLPRKMHAYTPSPGTLIWTMRTLKNPQI